MNYNNILNCIPPSPTVSFADRVRKLINDGKDIIPLQTGDPDFKTPEILMRGIQEALKKNYTHYCDSRGLMELRQKLAIKLENYNKIKCEPAEEILITLGGIHGYYCALSALINIGDEVLIPEPSWPSHFNIARLLGANVVTVPTTFENNFIPTIEDIKKLISPKTKVIVLNYPSNPTGAMPAIEKLTQIVKLALAHDLWIISDEVYEHIIFNQSAYKAVASIHGAKSKTISVFSFSKTYAMTGWRLGYTVAPKEVIDRMLKISQYNITNVPTFIQKAAADAINTAELASEVETMVKEYARRNQLVVDMLNSKSTRIAFHKPEGAFYYFLNLSFLKKTSVDLAESLLNEGLVAMVPGIAYGQSGEGKLRMTIAASEQDITIGLERTINWITKLAD